MQFRLKGADPIALKDGLYEKNMQLALSGSALAQFNIGYWEKKLHVSKGKENPSEWFLKAAVQGHPIAQYELGRSLVYGQGCRQDKAKGIEWLTRSAHNGQSDAKQLLAIVATHTNTLNSHQKALGYLDNIKKLSISSQLNYAWLLATSPFPEITNPQKAIKLVNNFSSKEFEDDITVYEIKAAAYATMGKFKKAVSYQEDALEEAEDRGANLDDLKTHLASYKNGETYKSL
jgi:tetratricopeptide (TPR) repeat protein